jgi:AcrR family transcriptional regulator
MELLNASEFSKRRLLLSALKLFAEQGIDAVSLRTINREAGARNNSALHYHFGSRLGLVEALAEFIQNWFEGVRETSLNAVEVAGDEAQVRDILSAFIYPYLQLLENEEWGYHAVRFLARMELEGGADIHAILNRFGSRSISRLKKVLIRKLPDIPSKLLMQRLNFCITSIVQGLADNEGLKDSYLGDMSCSLQDLGKIYLDYNAAGLAAPVE